MKARRIFWVAVLLAITATHAGTLLAQGDSAARFPFVAVSVGTLLQQIEAANPSDIVRDSAGNVVSVALRQGWANDHNLTLISTLDSLRRLALVASRKDKPTEHGLATLGRATNLVSLDMECSGPLQDGVFRATCNLKRLQCLRLYAAYPPVAEYNSITNLQDLAELHVTYCTNFGDEQLTLITNLPNLRIIELRADALSCQATNLLSSMRTLTNVVIKCNGR